MIGARRARTAVAATIATAVSTAAHPWAMPLPVVDPAAIAQATDALESADQMLASYTEMLATWTEINASLDSGMLGLVAHVGLPDGLDPAGALGALLGGQLPYAHLAGGLLDIGSMHPLLAPLALEELSGTMFDPSTVTALVDTGVLSPRTAQIVNDLAAIGALDSLDSQIPDAVAGLSLEVLHGTPITEALARLPHDASIDALRPALTRLDDSPEGLLGDLAQRITDGASPNDALRAEAWERRNALAGAAGTLHRTRPASAERLRGAIGTDPSARTDTALARARSSARRASGEPWLGDLDIAGWQHQIRTLALADPVRAQLGAAAHAAHDATLATNDAARTATEALRTHTPAPPAGSSIWHGAVHLARNERTRIDAGPPPLTAPGTPHATLAERMTTLTADAALDARALQAIADAIAFGLFDGDTALDDEKHGIARNDRTSKPWTNALPGDRSAVLEATATHTAPNAHHIAKALNALRTAHRSTGIRIDASLARIGAMPDTLPDLGPHNRHGLAPFGTSAVDAIHDALPVGLAARARAHCLAVPGCLWPRGGRLGPPRAHATEAAMHARSNDLLGSALAEGRNIHHLARRHVVPDVAPSRAELSMRTDAVRDAAVATAQAETGCPIPFAPDTEHHAFDDDPQAAPPIATATAGTAPATSPTDLLYLRDDALRTAPELRRIESARAAFERNVAIDTWASAVATATHDERRTRQHEALRERFTQCPDLLCELRTYVDVQRLNAQSAQQRLHTGLRHLELVIASDLRHQGIQRP